MKRLIVFLLLILHNQFLFSQATTPNINAVRTLLPIKIDGVINEEAWKKAPVISKLIQMRPLFGKEENEKNKTEAYLLYDDNAIYFGGFCHESHKDSLSKELAGRDEVGINDFIGIVFDTYEDKINGLGFYVTPLGEQFDIKYAIGNEDISWNAVYQTETKITKDGWSFEMRIPYSAIRFSKENIQNWGMNIIRRRTKSGQQFSWSPVNPANFGFMNQAGTLANIENIKPPIRLSFSPYFSTYATHNPNSTGKKWGTSLNGGMDLKYGITDGFTLDMTLIPDFGQVQSDNQVLNLTPFEVRFDENRSFFNEGTELFNKGNLFYSRRIGGQPIHYYNVTDNIGSGEKIIKNPLDTKLINATKISGRTAKKLGIGFFNAVTRAQYAIVEDENKGQYKVQTNPLTNYNVFVLDQALKNNSSVTLVNTNVWRSGKDYDANVTAVLWDLYDKKINWNIWGQVSHSRLIGYKEPGKTEPGYHYNIFAGKFKGRFNFDIHRFFADDKYNQRDMGYFTNNNYLEHGMVASYKWLKPKSFYNNIYLNAFINYSEMYKPRKFQYWNVNTNINSQLKNLWTVGFRADIRPEQQDFYEPRIWGKMVIIPSSWMKGFFVNTNRAKKYAVNLQAYNRTSSKYNSVSTDVFLSNNYRFSDKLSIGLSNFMEFYNRNLGFAFISDGGDSALFGLRNRRTSENIFNAKYNFNNKMGLTFRLRHYWSKVHYTQFFNLKDDGYVENILLVNKNPDNNVNFFNIDMNYAWQFGPGSFLNIAWKDAAELFNQQIQDKYYHNLRNTFNTPQQNTFSIKVIYYLDYLDLRGKIKNAG
ncbi:MAG: carbohydrate binding family 9 domain-containing protein [Chitinophagaceae bacterium]|nr:carbohydrate binding family 9 domain-containing protein [Chitinophagaceae bacterium]